MALPDSEPREFLNTREVVCRGYRRKDGLWDIEGHLVDTNNYVYLSRERGVRQPGESVHDMWLRLTLDDSFEVKQVVCSMEETPFTICGEIEPAFQCLVGLRIGPGWKQSVRTLLGGIKGCTHLVDLLGPMASTAIQTLGGFRVREAGYVETVKKSEVATCHALARKSDPPDGETPT